MHRQISHLVTLSTPVRDAAGGGSGPEKHRTRILIVDDYEGVAETLGSDLQLRGFDVSTSRDFVEARTKLLESRFDVLVTDVRLGAFNGLQLAVIARAKWPDMRIVVISGFDDPVLKAEASATHATYLVKPVSPEHLITALRSMEGHDYSAD